MPDPALWRRYPPGERRSTARQAVAVTDSRQALRQRQTCIQSFEAAHLLWGQAPAATAAAAKFPAIWLGQQCFAGNVGTGAGCCGNNAAGRSGQARDGVLVTAASYFLADLATTPERQGRTGVSRRKSGRGPADADITPRISRGRPETVSRSGATP